MKANLKLLIILFFLDDTNMVVNIASFILLSGLGTSNGKEVISMSKDTRDFSVQTNLNMFI